MTNFIFRLMATATLVGGLSVGSVGALQTPIVERNANASGGDITVNWTENYIEVTGRATVEPERSQVRTQLKSLSAARLVAQAQLMRGINALEIVSGSSIEDFVRTHQQVDSRAHSKVHMALQDALLVDEKIRWLAYEDGSREPEAAVTMRLCFLDNAPACRMGAAETVGLLRTIGFETLLGKRQSEARLQFAVNQQPPEGAPLYGSLIVVLADLSFDPMLAPTIISKAGDVIYDLELVDAEALFQRGLVHYAGSVEQALARDVMSGEALILRADSISDRGEIVVSKRDAARILSASAAGGNFLAAARVAVVLE